MVIINLVTGHEDAGARPCRAVAHFADQGGGATPLLELIGDEPGTVFSY